MPDRLVNSLYAEIQSAKTRIATFFKIPNVKKKKKSHAIQIGTCSIQPTLKKHKLWIYGTNFNS